MKEGWTYRKLGDVCDVLDSRRRPITKSERVPGSIPYYGATGVLDYVKDYIFDGRFLLVGEDGAKWGKDENTAFIIEGKSWVNNHAHIMSVHDDAIDSYLVYYLNGKDLTGYITGAVVPKLTQAALVSIPVPVPPLADQERIVAELDLLQGIIDKQKAQLKELDTLAQSIFYDMFGTTLTEKGWVVKSLGDLGTFQRGGGFLKSDYVDNGFPCIHYGQIHTKFSIATFRHLTSIPEALAKTKSKMAATGDVILAITSEDVEGSCKCTAWMGNYPVAVGGHTAIFKHTLNPIYAAYTFKSEPFQKAKEKYAHGFKVVEIKPSDIASISVCVPPRPLQDKFADSIILIEQKKSTINASIAETQKLFDYTMDKYFG